MQHYEHIETFDIDGTTIKIGIRYEGEGYSADLLQGYTGTGNCSGPKSFGLEQIIANMKKQHTYSYRFFECGSKQHKADNFIPENNS